MLIAGAGVAALEAALALRTLAEERVDIELVAPDVDFRYRPMSVAAPFGKGEARKFPLTRLVELAGARLTPGKLARVDLKARRAVTTDGAQLEWDVLLLAVGARMREGVPGSLTFRGEDDGRDLAETIDAAATGRVGSLTFALPTRAAWPLPLYELALMSKTELEDRGATDVSVA
ncbi:MAG TPA: hypothetical protein VHH31_00445, partial [Gaiellaceae bacterium]|nr:hypothetical protein [Gaiellaceae bacterium]